MNARDIPRLSDKELWEHLVEARPELKELALYLSALPPEQVERVATTAITLHLDEIKDPVFVHKTLIWSARYLRSRTSLSN